MSKKLKTKSEARFYAENAETNPITRLPVIQTTDITSVGDRHPTVITKRVGETVTVTVSLTGSGNTTTMSDAEICAWVMNKINS